MKVDSSILLLTSIYQDLEKPDMFKRPIMPQSEPEFMVIEITPYMGFQEAFRGSADECLTWCQLHRRMVVQELYKMTVVEDDLCVIILSSTLVKAAIKDYS